MQSVPPNQAKPQNPQPAAPPAAPPQATPAVPAAPPAATPAAAAPAPAPQTQPATAPPVNVTVPAALNFTGASLTEVIDILGRYLHLNYILDPRVKGTVNINTYGEIKAVDLGPLLETILRMNGFQMVQVGDMYRIVPIAEAGRLPVAPVSNATNLPDDESLILNLVFLKYVTSAEMAKLLEPFNGEGAKMIPYDPANLLIIEDNSRNMKRTMELIAMFDSDVLAGQRVHSYTTTNGRPSDIAKELDTIFKAYALSDKGGSVKFLPVDRINTLIAVAPNPGTFKSVEEWIKKLDIPAKPPVGSIDNHVYRLKYGRAEIIGPSISQLYGGPGTVGGTSYGQTQFGNLSTTGLQPQRHVGRDGKQLRLRHGRPRWRHRRRQYRHVSRRWDLHRAIQLDSRRRCRSRYDRHDRRRVRRHAAVSAESDGKLSRRRRRHGFWRLPRIIPNPYDNTLLIQSTPEQWAQIEKLLEQLDIPPRQVLIDCKIYEVDLSGALSYGVEYYLTQKANDTSGGISPQLVGQAGSQVQGISLSAGLLATQSRRLLAAVTASDVASKAKMIASPSIIATDSIPAAVNVGVAVPTLQSQAITGVQQAGSSLFANTISEQSTGVTLGIVARINASGVVTMVINQEFSQPIAPSAGSAIQSPSFSQRTISTQVTVSDGDTVAIGGIIQENTGMSTTGIPYLSRLPYIGGLFGYKSYTSSRTELLVFLTPRVIYDTNQIQDATQDLKERMKDLKSTLKSDQ